MLAVALMMSAVNVMFAGASRGRSPVRLRGGAPRHVPSRGIATSASDPAVVMASHIGLGPPVLVQAVACDLVVSMADVSEC